jgi:hypothetical protein
MNEDLENATGDYQGIATPTDAAPPAGDAPVYWLATAPGVYTNYGGVVLPANTIGIISRTGTTYTLAPITLTQMFKIITPDGTHATVQDWTPDFKGQIGVDGTGGNEVFYVARSVTSPTTKWEKLYTTFSLNAVLSNYALTTALSAYALNSSLSAYATTANMLKVLATTNPNDGNAGNAPLYKGQLGVTIDGTNEVYYIARSTVSPTTKWVRINTDAADAVSAGIKSQVAANSLVDNAKIVSKFDTERYAHASYIQLSGDYGFVVYMCNETGTAEGDPGQFIRLAKFHILTPEQKTIKTVAVPGGIYGAVTLDNIGLQVPNLITIGSGNNQDVLRVFFRGTAGGVQAIYYRDYTISTDTFEDAFQVQCKYKTRADGDTIHTGPFNQTNAYAHYDWLRKDTDAPDQALPGTYKEVFISSEMRRFTDGKLYSCVSLGSGLNKTTTCVLISSDDNGATWTLYYGPDPRTMPGTTETDYKYFWEAAVSEDATYIYIHARGASFGPAKGVWLQKIAKADLYTTTNSLVNVYPNSGQKPTLIDYPGIGTILITQSDKAVLPVTSFRTGVDFVLINAGYTTYTRLFTALDFNGIHTFSSVLKNNGEVYLTYSTSKRRIAQQRPAPVGDSYQNTSEIAITKLDRRYF